METNLSNSNNNNNQTNAARAAAQSTIDARIVKSTKSQYASKIKRMEEWFKTNKYRFRLPLNSKFVIDYFGSLIVHKEDSKQLSISSISSHKSALIWYYKENNHILDPLLKEELEKFLKGYKRIVSEKKLTGEMQAFEGKHYLSFTGYQLLANKFLKLSPTQSNHNFNQMLFAWPFLIFQWNLMARGGSTARILLQHISWRDDRQYIEEGKLLSELNKQQSNELFDRAYTDLLKQLYKPTELNGRISELSIATVYDRLCVRNKNNKRTHEEMVRQHTIIINHNNMEL